MSSSCDAKTAWAPYQPSADNPWDRGRSGTCTAGPGSARPRPNSTRGVKDGHEKTLDRILNGAPESEDFTRTIRVHGERAEHAARRAAGAARRRGGSTGCSRRAHPLREKMTLFWHNHFATSNAKVQNARLHARPVPS